jgi:hypothetical protein
MKIIDTIRSYQLPPLLLLAACAPLEPDTMVADQAAEAAPGTALTRDEQSRFLQQIQLHGFDAESVVFEGGHAIVDGDLGFDVRETLHEGEAVRDKAYRSTELVDPALFGETVVTLTADPELALSPAWASAAETAVQRWNEAAPWQRFKLTWLPPEQAAAAREAGRPVIEFKMMRSQKNAFARTDYPAGGRPAEFVGINGAYQGPDCQGGETTDSETVPFEQKVKTSSHELGHAFGLVHPGLGTLVIPGTASVERTPEGEVSMSYASLMWPGCIDGNFVVSSPSEDDIKAMLALESGQL